MSDDSPIRYEVAEGVGVITMHRPEARNAFTPALVIALQEAAVRAATDEAVRCVVLTGAGGHFAAGADVKAFAAASAAENARIVRDLTLPFHAAISALTRAEKPWIAAVDGTAAGGGFSLAIAADATLASERARFTFAYPGIGLAPDGSSSYSLPRLLGPKRALWFAFRNPTLTAAEALALGLVSEVLPAEGFEAQWRERARALAQGPTRAYAATKRLFRGAAEGRPLEAQMEDERHEIGKTTATHDFREGVTAFAEKRKARFEGR